MADQQATTYLLDESTRALSGYRIALDGFVNGRETVGALMKHAQDMYEALAKIHALHMQSRSEIMAEAFRSAASVAEMAETQGTPNAAAVLAEVFRDRARTFDPEWEPREKAKWAAIVERCNRKSPVPAPPTSTE